MHDALLCTLWLQYHAHHLVTLTCLLLAGEPEGHAARAAEAAEGLRVQGGRSAQRGFLACCTGVALHWAVEFLRPVCGRVAPVHSGRWGTLVVKGTDNAQVKVVDTGAAVLAAMRTAVFDIILLDIHMPEVRARHLAPGQCKCSHGDLSDSAASFLDENGGAWFELDVKQQRCAVLQMDGLQASTLIQQMYAPDDRPRIIAVSADTLQVRCHPPCTCPADCSLSVWSTDRASACCSSMEGLCTHV
jgi:CheY-like chemotaxis protein